MADFKSDLLGQKDLMRWGAAAIGAFALAFLAGNLAAFLPDNALTGLQATRLEGGNLALLRDEVERLRADLTRADRTDALLDTRISLIEGNRTDTARRIGALEASVPMLLEALPYDADIDYSALTASVGQQVEAPAEGGSVVVRRTPLFPANTTASTPVETPSTEQPMPVTVQLTPADELPTDGEFGLALGAAVEPQAAWNAWLAIADQVGALLIGLKPVLAPDENGDGASRLVAGPVVDYFEALYLCAAIAAEDVICQPVSYEGAPVTAPGTAAAAP